MKTAVVEEVIDRIAEIVRRVGKRDEIEEEVAQNINLSDLANELIKEEGPVREAAIKVISAVLKGAEIDSDSDTGSTIIDGIDFKTVAESMRADPDIQEVIKKLIKGVVGNLESDDEDVVGAVMDAFGLDSAEKLAEVLGKEVKSELDQVVVQKIKELIEGMDSDDLQESAEEIEKAVFTPDRVAVCLAGAGDKVNEAISGLVLKMVDEVDWQDQENLLCRAILSSNALQTAIDGAVDQLVRTGKVNQLVEDVTANMLASKNSSFRNRIEEAVSSQVVSRIAESVVSRLFDGRR